MSLRELRKRLAQQQLGFGGVSNVSINTHRMFEGIIEELEALWALVEPKDIDAHDATICKLREEQQEEKPRNMMQQRNSARAKVCVLKVECNKPRAEIEMWRGECREWQSSTHQLREELAEAKAEIESWMCRCHELERLLADHKASHAAAQIGRLVRGMREGTRLVCGIDNIYAVDECTEFNRANAGWKWLRGRWNDPAEALRAIQEVGDAEG